MTEVSEGDEEKHGKVSRRHFSIQFRGDACESSRILYGGAFMNRQMPRRSTSSHLTDLLPPYRHACRPNCKPAILAGCL